MHLTLNSIFKCVNVLYDAVLAIEMKFVNKNKETLVQDVSLGLRLFVFKIRIKNFIIIDICLSTFFFAILGFLYPN